MNNNMSSNNISPMCTLTDIIINHRSFNLHFKSISEKSNMLSQMYNLIY